MSRAICRLEEGHNWFPSLYRLSDGKPFHKNQENVVYQKLEKLDDVIFRVLDFGVRVFLHKVWLFSTKTRYLYLRLPFLKMKEFQIILTSLFFSLSWEKGRDLTQSHDKSPHTNRNVKRAKRQHKQRHKKVRLSRNICIKDGKIERLYACYMVEIRRFKMFQLLLWILDDPHIYASDWPHF